MVDNCGPTPGTVVSSFAFAAYLSLCISKRIRDLTDLAVVEQVAARHGQKIIPPARFFPDPELRAMIQKEPRGARILTSGDSVVAAYLRSGDLTDAFPARAGGLPDFTHLSGIVREEVQARALSGFWDLVRLNGTEISSDRDNEDSGRRQSS